MNHGLFLQYYQAQPLCLNQPPSQFEVKIFMSNPHLVFWNQIKRKAVLLDLKMANTKTRHLQRATSSSPGAFFRRMYNASPRRYFIWLGHSPSLFSEDIVFVEFSDRKPLSTGDSSCTTASGMWHTLVMFSNYVGVTVAKSGHWKGAYHDQARRTHRGC